MYDFPGVDSSKNMRKHCGRLLGKGNTRAVYEWLPDPTLVLKVEYRPGSFHNIEEHMAWTWLVGYEARNWLAPSVLISADGRMQLMKKTTPATAYPEKIPRFLTDMKLQNYGMFEDRFVCHDYGVTLLRTKGAAMAFKKVAWRNL